MTQQTLSQHDGQEASKEASKDAGQFEQALAELEGLVTSLEKGDMPLDEALQAFEKGTKLVSQCQTQLQQAELRVQQVVTNAAGDAAETTEFGPSN